jgi:hypothetical protein
MQIQHPKRSRVRNEVFAPRHIQNLARLSGTGTLLRRRQPSDVMPADSSAVSLRTLPYIIQDNNANSLEHHT